MYPIAHAPGAACWRPGVARSAAAGPLPIPCAITVVNYRICGAATRRRIFLSAEVALIATFGVKVDTGRGVSVDKVGGACRRLRARAGRPVIALRTRGARSSAHTSVPTTAGRRATLAAPGIKNALPREKSDKESRQAPRPPVWSQSPPLEGPRAGGGLARAARFNGETRRNE